MVQHGAHGASLPEMLYLKRREYLKILANFMQNRKKREKLPFFFSIFMGHSSQATAATETILCPEVALTFIVRLTTS